MARLNVLLSLTGILTPYRGVLERVGCPHQPVPVGQGKEVCIEVLPPKRYPILALHYRDQAMF